LNVGGHVPKHFEKAYLDNVIDMGARLIIMSWQGIEDGSAGRYNIQNYNLIVSIEFVLNTICFWQMKILKITGL
jgi:hypothetical protein